MLAKYHHDPQNSQAGEEKDVDEQGKKAPKRSKKTKNVSCSHPNCPLLFTCQSSMDNHRAMSHNRTQLRNKYNISSDKSTFKCEYHDLTFKTENGVLGHFLIHHGV